ncbi:hypothetical protein AVEN_263227-1 [Araneus ventricosus]|uniref:PiggyBac transposable element-derived protein domain-containing protein n=1 Tax=Araneus ventricosus TaxID=182803 RepID=A0A4Y2W9N8_ARAVE|nr:hypothetical protein AVEN_263227-1 [Araneus ventricosus]
MARDCFKEMIRFIRFNHKAERSEHLKSDKFALASALWCPFNENNASCYKPGVNLDVDEQLLPSKARCPFTQYIPNSKQPADQAVHEYVVMKLTRPYLGKGRNVTNDSYFSTVKYVKD